MGSLSSVIATCTKRKDFAAKRERKVVRQPQLFLVQFQAARGAVLNLSHGLLRIRQALTDVDAEEASQRQPARGCVLV